MSKKFSKYLSLAIFLLCAVAFVAKFATPALLRAYIVTGVGDCQKTPLFCKAPVEQIKDPVIDKEYVKGLALYEFPKLTVFAPKNFTAVQERITKVYYKKVKRPQKGPVIYFLYRKPDFFMELFPQLKRQGINNDYEFIRRTMYARLDNMKNLTDAFFVIMKGVFIPDLGSENNIAMAEFTLGRKKGFINYGLGPKENYFDCNVIDSQAGFFKVYVKDRGAQLDINKVLAIISTIEKAP